MKYPLEQPIEIKYYDIKCQSCETILSRALNVKKATCSECKAKRQREYYEKNKEKLNARRRAKTNKDK